MDNDTDATRMMVNHREILTQLKDKIQLLFGDFGSGNIGMNLSIKYYERDLLHLFVLRCPRESEDEVGYIISPLRLLLTTTTVISTTNILLLLLHYVAVALALLALPFTTLHLSDKWAGT